MKIKDGGPAFPSKEEIYHDGTWARFYTPGMTLRDYFAAAALQGLIACPVDFVIPGLGSLRDVGASAAAFYYADAMLKNREQPS